MKSMRFRTSTASSIVYVEALMKLTGASGSGASLMTGRPVWRAMKSITCSYGAPTKLNAIFTGCGAAGGVATTADCGVTTGGGAGSLGGSGAGLVGVAGAGSG